MSYSEQYTEALARYLVLRERKEARMAQVEAEVRAESRVMINLDAGLQHVINGRLATDPVLRDIQVNMDRATAEATMFGIGSIIQNLAFLAKRGEAS